MYFLEYWTVLMQCIKKPLQCTPTHQSNNTTNAMGVWKGLECFNLIPYSNQIKNIISVHITNLGFGEFCGFLKQHLHSFEILQTKIKQTCLLPPNQTAQWINIVRCEIMCYCNANKNKLHIIEHCSFFSPLPGWFF